MASSVDSNFGRLVGKHLTCVEICGTYNRTVKVAEFQLEAPNVAWSLVVTVQPLRSTKYRSFGVYVPKELSISLQNVSGSNKEQVMFTSVVSSFEPSAARGGQVVSADGLLCSECVYLKRDLDLESPVLRYILTRVYDKGPHRINGNKRDLVFDLDKLLQDSVLCDVVLQVQGDDQKLPREFGAHKAVLAARSPVFQRLFQTDMAEAKTATVTVGFSAEVTELVLRYVYTDTVDFGGAEGNPAMDLLAAANYYQLDGLKDICEAALLQRVGAKQIDVLETIVLADQCGAAKLKRAALDSAASNMKELLKHQHWAVFMVDHRSLVNELIGVLAEKVAPE